MSEDTKTGGESQGFTPPATQDELNRIISDRVERERKKFADYDDLKAKADQFDQMSKSKESDQKQTDARISKLEAELAGAKFDAERERIKAKHGISDDDADLFLTATDTDKLEAQAKALADRVTDRKKNGPVVPAQKGSESDGGAEPMRDLTRRIFKRD